MGLQLYVVTGTVDLKHMRQMLSLGHDSYGEVND